MANLLKQSQIICKTEGKRVINSNELIAEKIKEYMKSQQEEDENYADEFCELMDSEKVEKLLEDKNEALESVNREEILGQAHLEAEEILEKARLEADDIKRQAFDSAEKQGYDSGYAKGLGEVEQMKNDLKIQKAQFEQNYQKELDNMEPALVDVILEVVESVFQIQFAQKKDFVLHLIQATLNKIEGSKDYLIRVSKDDFALITEKKNDIQSQLPRNSVLEIVEDLTLVKNQCLVETDGGVFDCSLDTQFESLTRDLRTLSTL